MLAPHQAYCFRPPFSKGGALRVAVPARHERTRRFFSIAFLCAYFVKEKRLKSFGIDSLWYYL